MLHTKIKAISKEKKIPVSKIEKDCGLIQGSIGHWDEVKPSYDKVVAVAGYLDMTVEELLKD
jgi:hypothetical protein